MYRLVPGGSSVTCGGSSVTRGGLNFECNAWWFELRV